MPASNALAHPDVPTSRAGGSAATPTSGEGCSFELDVQWILDAVDKVSEFLRNMGEAVNKVFDIIGEVLHTLAGIAECFAWVPGLGKMAKTAIRWACDKAGDAAEFCYNLEADLLQFCKNALAPWEIRSAGKGITEQIVPREGQLTEEFGRDQFSSDDSWKGKAADRFRTNLDAQHAFSEAVQRGVEEFGSCVKEMGDEGVKATMQFVIGFIKASISLIRAIAKLWAVPVGTAIAAKDVIKLVFAIIKMVKVWVKLMLAIAQQASQLEAAAEHAAPGDEWRSMVR